METLYFVTASAGSMTCPLMFNVFSIFAQEQEATKTEATEKKTEEVKVNIIVVNNCLFICKSIKSKVVNLEFS